MYGRAALENEPESLKSYNVNVLKPFIIIVMSEVIWMSRAAAINYISNEVFYQLSN